MTPEAIAALPWRPCVGIMLVNGAGRVFVGRRSDRDQDAWQMPQGGVDPGETPEVAALRELEEETGITADLVRVEAVAPEAITYDLPPEVIPTIGGGRYRGQSQVWVLARFHGRDDQVNIATKHPEFNAWEWCEPALLVPRIVPFKREAYARVLQMFGDRL